MDMDKRIIYAFGAIAILILLVFPPKNYYYGDRQVTKKSYDYSRSDRGDGSIDAKMDIGRTVIYGLGIAGLTLLLSKVLKD